MRFVQRMAGAVAVACSLVSLADAQEKTPAATPPDKLFFFGFEKDRIEKDWLMVSREDGDVAYLIWPGDRGARVEAVRKGDATEGQWAFMINITNGPANPFSWMKSIEGWKRKNPNYGLRNMVDLPWNRFKPGYTANFAPPEKFTELAENREGTGTSATGGRLESSSEHHSVHTKFYTAYAEGGVEYTAESFPTNWSGYGFLRMDVKSEKGELSLRMAFEDDKVAPPVEKRYVVQPGAWRTVEIDLDQAVKERNVNLARIVNFWVYLEEATQPGLILVDNLRLSKKGVAAKLPMVAGGPRLPRPVAPMPKADTSAVKKETGKLTLGEPGKNDLKVPAGLIRLWAYDNLRLVMDVNGGVYYTLDGGKVWQPVAGSFRLPSGIATDPQAATDMDENGNVAIFGNFGHCIYHCAPPMDSMYLRKLVFAGNSWTVSPLYIVGGETRKCVLGKRMLALPGGRLWVAYRVRGRQPVQGPWPSIDAMYSDDGGLHWRAAGVDGKLTGTLADTLVGGPSGEDSGNRGYLFDILSITPYGNHVAVLWAHGFKNSWSFFDGVRWSPAQAIPGTLPTAKSKPRYFGVATAGDKEILVATDRGMNIWDGTSWKADESMKGAYLTMCGKTVVGFSVEDKDGGSRILFWKRSPQGVWVSKEIAAEPQPILFNVRDRPDLHVRCLAVPKHSPANYAPVAWTCKGANWVKVLRVPVDEP